MSREDIPTATAVPASDNSSFPISSIPVHASTTAHAPATTTTGYLLAETNRSAAVLETEQIGICRRCRREFRRQAGVHSGLAQYYRCSDCEKLRMQDTIEGSCITC